MFWPLDYVMDTLETNQRPPATRLGSRSANPVAAESWAEESQAALRFWKLLAQLLLNGKNHLSSEFNYRKTIFSTTEKQHHWFTFEMWTGCRSFPSCSPPWFKGFHVHSNSHITPHNSHSPSTPCHHTSTLSLRMFILQGFPSYQFINKIQWTSNCINITITVSPCSPSLKQVLPFGDSVEPKTN